LQDAAYTVLVLRPSVRQNTHRKCEYTPVEEVLGPFTKLLKATISFVMYVCRTAWNNSCPIGWIITKFDIFVFKKNCQKVEVLLKSEKNKGCLT